MINKNPFSKLHPKFSLIIGVFLGFIAFFSLFIGFSQSINPLNARLNKIAGYSSGDDIQGDFRIIVAGPENLTLVKIYFNETEVYNTTEHDFSWAFDTGMYPIGEYNITVQGWDTENNLYQWNTTRFFIPPSVNDPYWVLLVGIGVLIGIIGLISYKRQKKEAKAPPPQKIDVDIKLDKNLL